MRFVNFKGLLINLQNAGKLTSDIGARRGDGVTGRVDAGVRRCNAYVRRLKNMIRHGLAG